MVEKYHDSDNERVTAAQIRRKKQATVVVGSTTQIINGENDVFYTGGGM